MMGFVFMIPLNRAIDCLGEKFIIFTTSGIALNLGISKIFFTFRFLFSITKAFKHNSNGVFSADIGKFKKLSNLGHNKRLTHTLNLSNFTKYSHQQF